MPFGRVAIAVWACLWCVVGCAAQGGRPANLDGSDTAPPRGKGDIYGEDGRVEPYDPRVSPELAERARSAAMLVRANRLPAHYDDGGPFELTGPSYARVAEANLGAPLCEGEPFADQPLVGSCSAFLVGRDVLATAGHCIRSQRQCEETAVVFGFAYEDDDHEPPQLRHEDVYRCRRLLTSEWARPPFGHDWAVILLDRDVERRDPLELREEGFLWPGEPLTAIGHPHGMPQKLSLGGHVTGSFGTRLTTTLDAVAGNSGGAVLHAETLQVEGIVTFAISLTSLGRRGVGPLDLFAPASSETCFESESLIPVPFLVGLYVEPTRSFREVVRAASSPERRVLVLEDPIGGDIPDSDGLPAGLQRSIVVESPGRLVSAWVEGSVEHPNGRVLSFAVRKDGSSRGRIVADGEPGDRRFHFAGKVDVTPGEDAAGTWTLDVWDHTPGGTGSLEGWELTLLVQDP